MKLYDGQLTGRGIAIGVIGCVVITAASAYTALKMGALPWPIIFAALIALAFLRMTGSRSLNEANVTHTIMSAGAMVAGGLAFTIPGIWILGLGDVPFWQLFLIALAGTLLGLVASAYLRPQFIEKEQLEFPIGEAAAETLIAGNEGGKVGRTLFGSMGFAGLWTVLRDVLGVIPAMVGNLAVPGVTFGVYLSPLMMSVGFLVGSAAMVAWMAGGIVQLLLVAGGSTAGLYDLVSAQALNSSLGMGLMMGAGISVVAKDVIWKGVKHWRANHSAQANDQAASKTEGRGKAGLWALLIAIAAYIICLIVGIGPVGSVIVVLFSFVCVAMGAQSVGQTGIDPMEIFGLIVLLIVAAIGDTQALPLFFVAAIIAVACGLGGDVMNDFKAGHILGTNPNAQVAGQAIGGIVGAFIAAVALAAISAAYGPDAFGVGKEFVAAQASVVATLVSGIPNLPAFIVGLVLGFLIHLVKGPAMMIGLGVYLPFYMTLTAFIGCIIKWIYQAIKKHQQAKLPEEHRAAAHKKSEQSSLIVASGFLGGESIVGVVVAIVSVCAGLAL